MGPKKTKAKEPKKPKNPPKSQSGMKMTRETTEIRIVSMMTAIILSPSVARFGPAPAGTGGSGPDPDDAALAATDFPQAGQKLAPDGISFPQNAQNAIAIPSYVSRCLRIAQDPSNSAILEVP